MGEALSGFGIDSWIGLLHISLFLFEPYYSSLKFIPCYFFYNVRVLDGELTFSGVPGERELSAFDIDYDSDDDELFEDENFVRNLNTIVKAPDTTRLPIVTSPSTLDDKCFTPDRLDKIRLVWWL